MVCTQCGTHYEDAKFCPECGAPKKIYGLDEMSFNESAPEPPPKGHDPIGISGVLLIILGFIFLSAIGAIAWALIANG